MIKRFFQKKEENNMEAPQPEVQETEPQAGAAEEPKQQAAGTYDAEELDVKEGLEYAVDSMEFYLETLELYIKETSENEKKMAEHLANEDLDEYSVLAHSIKSSSRIVGAMKLGDDAYELEMKSKEHDMDYVKSHHEAFLQHLETVRENIRLFMAANQ